MAKKTTGILKLRDHIPWEGFRPLLEELTGDAIHDGRKADHLSFDHAIMFKVLALQKFHGLSDNATEEPISDRFSFKNSLSLRIGDDIPDAKTLGDLSSVLRKTDAKAADASLKPLLKPLKTKVSSREKAASWTPALEKPLVRRNSRDQNPRIKEGQRPEELDTNPAVGRQKNSQARWPKKNHEVPYGWKNHLKADLKTKLILSSSNTSANIYDSQVVEELLDDGDQAVLAESSYHSDESKRH